MLMRCSTRYLVVLSMLTWVGPLRAQDILSGVALHGFGSWAYGRTGHNVYLAGNPDGDFRHVSMAFNLSARVSDHLVIHTQAEIQDDQYGTQTTLGYAFADYKVSDRLSIRIGQVKHPFGLHTEVVAVGTLRPFMELPQGFYGPVGFIGESYKGIGILGAIEAGRWTFAYDAYGGGIDLKRLATPEEFYNDSTLPNTSEGVELQSSRNVFGVRLVLHTPVQGLSLGGSSQTGVLNEPAANRRTTVAAHIAYQSNSLTLESEIAYENQVDDEHSTGGYILAAYRLSPEWQVALQGDYVKSVYFGVDPSPAPSLQYHREGAAALSYWVSRALVIKAEYHIVSGNRFAMPHPASLAGVIAANQLHTRTHLFQVGGQFSF